MTYSHTPLVLVAACLLLATLLITNAATAQTTVLDVKDKDDNPLAQVNDQGDLTANGWIKALIGFKFPDGTMQTTAATGGIEPVEHVGQCPLLQQRQGGHRRGRTRRRAARGR